MDISRVSGDENAEGGEGTGIDRRQAPATRHEDSDPIRTRVLVISLPSAVERRTQFETMSQGTDDWAFFDACTTIAPGMIYDPARARREFGRELVPAELGCYASHYSVWKQLAADDQHDRYIVLEDDVIVDWDFIKELAHADLDDIGYLRLFYRRTCPSHEIRRAFIRRDRNIIELYGFAFGTQAYLITRAQAVDFVERFAQVIWPIDNTLDRTWANGIRNVAVFPFPVIERLTPSLIGENRFRVGMSPFNYRQLREKLGFYLGRILFAVRAGS